jgi:dihydroorotate dehydrogenase
MQILANFAPKPLQLYKFLVRTLLFLFPSEKAHYLALDLLKWTLRIPFKARAFDALFVPKGEHLKRHLFGLTFRNPVGLAAGFDKDARFYNELSHLGFGFIEVGTVTPEPQAGNPKPRLFRLVRDEALINRMGFNNEGLEAMIERLKKRRTDIVIGGNIGKNKITPNEQAVDDYLKCFHALYPYVDYFVVNVSSPNTPDLRELQDKAPLTALLNTLIAANRSKPSSKPILLKIAPDLNEHQLDDIIEIVSELEIAGIVATNTTISREGLSTPRKKVDAIGNGGLSGKPVRARSTEVIRYISEKTGGTIPIIAVGGIFTAEHAREKLAAGASLVQVYTGFIYEGPGIVRRICKGL